VRSEVHDRDARAPEDEPHAADGQIDETDRDAKLLDLSNGTEQARQAVKRRQKSESEPDQSDGSGENAGRQRDRDEARRRAIG
jgi:hypothetical protein